MLLERRFDWIVGTERRSVQVESIFVAMMKVLEKKTARSADEFGVPTADLTALAFRPRCCEVIVRGRAIALIRRFLHY